MHCTLMGSWFSSPLSASVVAAAAAAFHLMGEGVEWEKQKKKIKIWKKKNAKKWLFWWPNFLSVSQKKRRTQDWINYESLMLTRRVTPQFDGEYPKFLVCTMICAYVFTTMEFAFWRHSTFVLFLRWTDARTTREQHINPPLRKIRVRSLSIPIDLIVGRICFAQKNFFGGGQFLSPMAKDRVSKAEHKSHK